MEIFEFTVPGERLDYQDADFCRAIECQLEFLKGLFYEANISCYQFEMARDSFRRRPDMMRSKNRFDRIEALHKGVKAEVEEAGEVWSDEDLRSYVDLAYKRERWGQGNLPSEYPYFILLMYAKSFVYALDCFEKILGLLAKVEGVPDELEAVHDDFLVDFKSLKSVRDSAHHPEDRIRGLKRKTKKIDIKAVDNGAIIAPAGGILAVNILIDNRIGGTAANGELSEVVVCRETVERLLYYLERINGVFTWTGTERHFPSADV